MSMFALRLVVLLSVGLLLVRAGGVASSIGVLNTSYLLILAVVVLLLLPQLVAISGLPTRRAVDWWRVRIKTLVISLGLVAMLIYAASMDKLGGVAFSTFATHAALLLPGLLFLLPFYVCWVDRRLEVAEDGYWMLGLVVLRRREWRWQDHRHLLLSWLVKILFAPIMLGGLLDTVARLIMMPEWFTGMVLIDLLFNFGLAADLTIASIGYLFASKLLGNEVRSVDPSWRGWVACLVCYPPFVFLLHTLTQQADRVTWTDWLYRGDLLYWPWAFVMASSWVVYWWSTAVFCHRFSNLTWRGLVCSGPYRLSKHPAYISKNIYWWMSTVPFVGVSNEVDLLRNIAGMSFLSLVYYWRARTEEQHLCHFPEYKAYATYMEQHSFIAILRRVLNGGKK
jgi:Isoprenylcysteine carboxyl methyltransferase (ICMT) family